MSGTTLLPPAPAAARPVRWLGAAVDWAVVMIGALLVALVFVNVVLHQLSRDLAWVIELSELLLVWATFLGAASATRRGGHMAVTEVIDRVRGMPRRLVEVTIRAAVCAALLAITAYGWRLADASWGSVLTVLGWPMAIQYLALPVGTAITLVFAGSDLVAAVRAVRTPAPVRT